MSHCVHRVAVLPAHFVLASLTADEAKTAPIATGNEASKNGLNMVTKTIAMSMTR
jgi:hypothetical protein